MRTLFRERRKEKRVNKKKQRGGGKLEKKKSELKRSRKDRQKNLLLFLIPCLLIFIFQWTGIFESVDRRIQDSHYQKGGLVSPEIYVIGIDEETMMEYGSWQNWSRKGTADILRVLNQNPDTAPAVIGLDIGFFGESTPEADLALSEAASLIDNVVVTSYASFGQEIVEKESGSFSAKESVVTYEIPYDGLREHVSYGFSNVPLDGDGIVRHSLYSIETGNGQKEYSFSAEIYRKYMGVLPAVVEEGKNQGYIPFSGFPFDFYGSETAGLSFSKVVNGEIPAELFAGTIVLVGPFTSGMMDSYYTAVSHDVPMYGVEIHANILQSFLEDNRKTEISASSFMGLCITAAVMVLVFLCLSMKKIHLSMIFVVCVLCIYWFASGAAYEKGCILFLLYPMAAAVILSVYHIGLQYIGERKAKKRIEGIFGKYVSKEVAANLVKGGEDALKLGGQKKDVAVLFVDIRGFTPLSESLPPEKVVEILNQYLELTTSAVFKNKGTVDKFIGDATMAIYNAPLDLDDYVFRAVKTGLDMAEAAANLEKELKLVTDKKVGFGVGVNCGEAVIGNIGTSSRMDYTAIGNTVNVAARLEGQAKAGQVVISQAVYDRLKGRIRVESLGKRTLKGIAGESEVYRVDGIIEEQH